MLCIFLPLLLEATRTDHYKRATSPPTRRQKKKKKKRGGGGGKDRKKKKKRLTSVAPPATAVRKCQLEAHQRKSASCFPYKALSNAFTYMHVNTRSLQPREQIITNKRMTKARAEASLRLEAGIQRKSASGPVRLSSSWILLMWAHRRRLKLHVCTH